MRRHCLRCGEGNAARYPRRDAMFCSQRCAAAHGIEQAMDKRWCRRHGWWDARDDECYDCERERRTKGE